MLDTDIKCPKCGVSPCSQIQIIRLGMCKTCQRKEESNG